GGVGVLPARQRGLLTSRGGRPLPGRRAAGDGVERGTARPRGRPLQLVRRRSPLPPTIDRARLRPRHAGDAGPMGDPRSGRCGARGDERPMMVQQHHQPRLFDVRRMPLAVHARRDWLEVLRGALPPLVPPVRPKRGRAPLVELYIVGVARGLLVGAGAGAIAATVLVPFALLFGTVAGAAVGFVVAALPSLLLAGGITVLAAHRHRPLRDPREFHREVWSLVLVGVGVLNLVAVALASLL